MSPLMILPPIVFAGLAVMFYVGMQQEDRDALPSAFSGKPAPVVELTELGGEPAITDEMLRSGGVKLVNFWASWCGPCRVEHPTLEQLSEEGVTIYGINYKDQPGNALDFLAELGNPYAATSADATGRAALEWGVYGVPETFVLDANGTIILRFAGPVTQRVLANKIRPAMAEAAGSR